jgi:hypothetical protein
MDTQRRVAALTLGAAVALLSATGAPWPIAHAATTPAARVPFASMAAASCAWPASSNEANVAYPDRNATYWGTPYALQPGQKLVIKGLYPFNRYFSFETYDLQGRNIGARTDYQIAPDQGSANPFVNSKASSAPAQRHYTVSVVSDAQGGANILSGQTASGKGLLVYRVYVPNPGLGHTAGVPLPTLALQAANRNKQTLPLCSSARQASGLFLQTLQALNQHSVPPGLAKRICQWQGRFGRPGNLAYNLLPNPDNSYLCAVTAWKPGRVVVIRGKAPTFPDTTHGVNVTTPSQLRYWSFCTNQVELWFPVTACKADYQVALDAQGYYNFVVSTLADKPSNATAAHGVTWLDWGPTNVPGALILRNMLPAAGFHHAVQDAPKQATPQLAAQVMGAYYPQAVYCTTAQFEAGGPPSCFSARHQ